MDAGVVLSSSAAWVWKLFCWCLRWLERLSFLHSFTVSVGRAFTPFWEDIIQTINMSQLERNIQHECDEESCSQDELLNTVETCGHPVWWSSGKINTFLLLYVKLWSWALLRNVSHCLETKKSTTRVDECASKLAVWWLWRHPSHRYLSNHQIQTGSLILFCKLKYKDICFQSLRLMKHVLLRGPMLDKYWWNHCEPRHRDME